MPLDDPLDLAFHAFRFLYECKALSFDLVNDEDVDDEEVIEPRWYAIADLKANQLQSFGNNVVDYFDGK